MRLARAWAGAAALLLAFAAWAQDSVPVPKLTTRVTDQTGTLSVAQREGLEAKLAAFEQAKGSQVAVLLVPTVGSETIEEFAGRVADSWQLGRKGVDDGVLFVVAMQERRMRIHTGRGVQGTLTDALSKRIVSEVVTPHFRAGDFPGGIQAGVDAILKAIEGEGLPAPAERRPGGQRGGEGLSSFTNFLFLGFFLVPVVASVLRGIFGRFLGAGVTSGLTGAAAWLVFGSIALGVVGALFAFVLTIFSGAGFARSAGRGGWGGYIPGGGGGGSWGGGGGFGGGGGGFDGGGASGGW